MSSFHGATAEGTRAYCGRFLSGAAQGHFRSLAEWQVGSLGFGSYLGDCSSTDDEAYLASALHALQNGVNLLDSAINYRCMRSEQTLGRALQQAFKEGYITREEVVVATKGGYIPFKGSEPASRDDYIAYVKENYLAPGLCTPDDIAGGMHCMAPAYLKNQVEQSLENWGLKSLDIYYLHNPETQLGHVDREEFLNRVRKAFGALEECAGKGQIGCYGVATWNGFRVGTDHGEHLSLEELMNAAQDVAGEAHHFKVAQLPFNLAMTEAASQPTQELSGQSAPFLNVAHTLGIAVVTSASLLQSRLTRDLPPPVSEALPGLKSDTHRALQFVRSAPGIACALVGMKTLDHLRENLSLAAYPLVETAGDLA